MSNSAPHPGSGGIAVITGASSGLGAAFAREFARRGSGDRDRQEPAEPEKGE